MDNFEGQSEAEGQPPVQALARAAPGCFGDGMLRTFQRRVKAWRSRQHGADPPARTLYFAQRREPGHEIQLDWFDAKELGVSIGGELFAHKICNAVLPYFNRESASALALG